MKTTCIMAPLAYKLLSSFLILFTLLTLSGCGVTKSIDDAISQIDQTRQSIEAISGDWRAELPKLVDSLAGMENNMASDVQSVVIDSKNQVQDLANQTIQLTDSKAQNLIAQAGVEFRCNADFVKTGTIDLLKYLVDDLKFWKQNKSHLNKKPDHAVCWINPSVLKLYPSGAGWSIDTSNMSDPNIAHVYGYNFQSDRLPTLEMHDASGNKIRDVTFKSTYVTHYQINLDFSNENFAGIGKGDSVVFRWPDKEDPNAINLTPMSPSLLKIVAFDFSPAQPTAGIDPVILHVKVQNQGDLRSGSFKITWKPDPNDPRVVDIIPDKPLEAGESRDFYSTGYVFKHDGSLPSVISISSGDDIKNTSLSVNPTPKVVLTNAMVQFGTTNDNKDHDTKVHVYLICSGVTYAEAHIVQDVEFKDNTTSPWFDFTIDQTLVKDDVIPHCSAKLVEQPNGHDEWHFTWKLQLGFSDGTSTTFNWSNGNVDYDRTTLINELRLNY